MAAYAAGAPAPAEWPLVTVQLPVYNELPVVARLLAAAVALDYPAGRLRIQLLDDSTDESVALAAGRVAHYQARGLCISHVRRPTRQGYKAGALAHGLAETDAKFIAIFNADFLRRAVLYQLCHSMVQTRWGHLNEDASLLTRLQAFGLNAHFLVEQVGRQAGTFSISMAQAACGGAPASKTRAAGRPTPSPKTST